MATHFSTLAWKIPWRKSLVDYSPWGHKELDTTEQLHSLCDKRALTVPKAGSKPQLLEPVHVTSFGKMVRAAVVNDSEMKASFCIIPCGLGPKCIHKYLKKRKVKGDQTITQRRPRETETGTEWNDTATIQQHWEHQKLREARTRFSPEAAQGLQFC